MCHRRSWHFRCLDPGPSLRSCMAIRCVVGKAEAISNVGQSPVVMVLMHRADSSGGARVRSQYQQHDRRNRRGLWRLMGRWSWVQKSFAGTPEVPETAFILAKICFFGDCGWVSGPKNPNRTPKRSASERTFRLPKDHSTGSNRHVLPPF